MRSFRVAVPRSLSQSSRRDASQHGNRHARRQIGTLPVVLLGLVIVLAAAPLAQAQLNPPHVGYVFPAGGRPSDTFQATIGGQYLSSAAKPLISGSGVEAKFVAYTRPLMPQQANKLREKVQELRKKPKDAETNQQIAELLAKLATFVKKPGPALAEKVTLQITIASDAEPGDREVRLETANGLSNPCLFHVGSLPEFRKPEPDKRSEVADLMQRKNPLGPNRSTPGREMSITLPATVNGQVLPGGVDRYRFPAHKGQRLVVAVSARELIPYLADAVPGWFQAAVTIYDSQGNELAYDDHYRFRPDPVLCCKIPKDGQYVLEIRDSLYRGREDFVYRVTLGELPFVTGIFPLGGPAGTQTTVELTGWNLPVHQLTVDATGKEAGMLPLSVRKGKLISNHVPFAVDTLPECREQEPNDQPANAQPVTLPVIVNGHIDPPGDWDVFRFEGHAGQRIVAEVDARKLDSPLDSVLKLSDAHGKQLAFNDDYLDRGTGLSTHHADSLLTATLPVDGVYYLHLGDAEHKGGGEYAYRLRISAPRPDFALRIVPSGINVHAGGTVPITAYALRKDGFSDEIALDLKAAPKGFTLSGARVPANQNQVQLTLTAPQDSWEGPVNLSLEGHAVIEGGKVTRPAVPAEDMMQAFIYHHLVTAQNFSVARIERGGFKIPLTLLDPEPVKLVPGDTVPLRFSLPRRFGQEQVRLALNEPPEGVSLQKVSPAPGSITLFVHADAAKAKPGWKGNLIVDVAVERTMSPAGGKQAARNVHIPLGTLPAIPFEIADKSQPSNTTR